MIETLSIRNIALIDELDLELAPGLNIFTGETGAGKSVILRAMGLVLGERASADIVREGANFAEVEASVAPDDEHPIWRANRTGDSEDSDETTDPVLKGSFRDVLDPSDAVILSRRITASGRSRCHVNGRLANLKQAAGTRSVACRYTRTTRTPIVISDPNASEALRRFRWQQ